MDDPHGDDIARVIQTLQQATIEDHDVEGLVQASGQPMLILDEDGRVRTTNARAEALLEREARDVRNRPFSAFVRVQDRASVRRRIGEAARKRQGPSDLDAHVLTRNDAAIPATITFLPFTASRRARVALLVRERTSPSGVVDQLQKELEASEARRSETQARLERDQKLTDLGRIVSGVAHEIKSPIAYIENLAYLSEAKAERLAGAHPEIAAQAAELRANAAMIREGAQRVRHLLDGLQPLTRNRPARRAPVDLSVLVADAVRTFQGSAKDVETRIELDLQATHPVELDIEEMSRVVLNLLKNASEAMDGGGRIRIRTLNREHPPQVRVEDEGPGVPDATRLFEPFYTTKKEGTGLGLAISRRIVEAHGGSLRYERNEKGGATFVVEFPRH